MYLRLHEQIKRTKWNFFAILSIKKEDKINWGMGVSTEATKKNQKLGKN